MDQMKIGKFIASMRKEQGLSQKQLAERIGVTDKTISKWETGNRLPDASILLKLSQELHIDVNELLAGEAFSSKEFSAEEYVKKSESNLVGLVGKLNEDEEKRKGRGIGTVTGIVCIALAFAGVLVSSLPMGGIVDILDLPTLCYLSGLKFLIITFSGRFHDYLNAWRLLAPGTELSGKEMESSMEAVKYAGALSLSVGGVIASIGLFSLLNYLNAGYLSDFTRSGPAFAQVVLTLFYTAIAKTVYVIVLYRVKRRMENERRQEWDNY